MPSLQGQFLIASPRLGDPNFVRSVVLMVQHTDEGAGLILNRPLGTTVREVCEKVLETDCAIEAFLHQGGPCEGPLMVLHMDDSEDGGGEVEVMPGVHFTAERGKIEHLLMSTDDVTAKFFVGYAGWGAGQLEGELETGSWLTVKAESQHVFDGGDKLWSRLTTAVTAGIDPDTIPEDPSMN